MLKAEGCSYYLVNRRFFKSGTLQSGGTLTSSIASALRRLRYGKPIVIVSGLPRSGTSMAMKMLAAGGMPLLTDGVRGADESNPKGYYEFEPVKDLHKHGDMTWLRDARGKAVKIVSFLLTFLPETNEYKVIFMQRDLREVMASERTMLQTRGETAALEGPGGDEEQTRTVYEQHLAKVHRFLANRKCFSTLTLSYRDALEHPRDAATRIRDFVGHPLDVAEMEKVADPALYRNRA
jgi:hypothetical protein